jgi:hypothetical protein
VSKTELSDSQSVLIVGDLHTKVGVLPLIDEFCEKYSPSRVLLVGDYLDDFYVSEDDNVRAFEAVVEWAKNRGDVTLLYGNHELAYYLEDEYDIFDCDELAELWPEMPNDVNSLLHANASVFKVADSQGDWIFTHAGISQSWTDAIGIKKGQTAQSLATELNGMFMSAEGREELQSVLVSAQGHSISGPFAISSSELLLHPYIGINQAVGHTPVRTCECTVADDDDKIAFCDTLGLDMFGNNLGDKSMLLLEGDVLYKIVVDRKEELYHG